MCPYSFGSQRFVSGFWTRMSLARRQVMNARGLKRRASHRTAVRCSSETRPRVPRNTCQAPGRFNAAANWSEDERDAEECRRGPEPGVRPCQVPREVERMLPMQAPRDPEGRELPDHVLEPMEPANVPQDWGAAQPARRVDLDEMDASAFRSQAEATLEVGSIPLDRERDHPDFGEAREHPRPGPPDRMFGTASRHGAVRVSDDLRDSRSAGVPESRRASPGHRGPTSLLAAAAAGPPR